MGKISNLAGLFGDTKTRTIVIFTAVILAVGIGIAVTGLKEETVATGSAQTAGVPRNIKNVPGAGQATAQYEALQLEENRRNYEAARASGTSAIPTLMGKFAKVELEPEEEAVTQTGTQSRIEERIRLQQQAVQQRIALEQVKRDAEQKVARQQQFEAETRDGFGKSMGKQAKALLSTWSGSPNQAYVIGNAAKETNKTNTGQFGATAGNRGLAGGAGGRSATGSRAPNMAKAGDMVFAVLNTSIDSNDNGPVIATVVSGKMKGSKIIGAYTPTENGQRILLKFTKISLPKADSSMSINTVAVNPFNGRTGMATSVDNHYLRRYGGLFVSSLLTGYGEAIKDQGSTETSRTDGSVTTSTPTRSGSEELLIALSNVGTTLGGKLDSMFDMKPTVKVNEGLGLGILFLEDFSAEGAA